MVTVTDTARASMTRYAMMSTGGREVGGILLGHHQVHPPPVLNVVYAARAVRRTDFSRRDMHHAQDMADLTHHTNASVWIGDRHTHPGGPAQPSDTDLPSYRTLLVDSAMHFEVFLTAIVTSDPATGWACPISTAGVHMARQHARLRDGDAA